MSLKEWKDNELNMLLMKKWGLLKEQKDTKEGDDDDNPIGRPTHRHSNPLKALSTKDYEGIGSKEHGNEEDNEPSMAKDMDLDEEAQHPGQSCDEAHPGEGHPVEEEKNLVAQRRKALIDPGMFEEGNADEELEEASYRDDELEDSSDELEEGDPLMKFKEGKISVKEAKQITRRIIERIRKEGK